MLPALSLQNIEHVYGTRPALDKVSFDLWPGQILCLLGPSGCGKTTALRAVAGLERPRHGTIRLGARLVTGDGIFVPPEQRDVGLLFQDFALFPHLTIFDNIAFGLRQHRASYVDDRVEGLLDRFGLNRLRRAYPHMLSGGEQQRVALARALAPHPKILLLDEPFSDLDTRLRQQIRDETLHVLKEIGASVLLVTHDPEEALFMGDRIALMRDGRILQTGEPADLYRRPNDIFVAEFFGEVNRIPTRVKDGQALTPFGPVAAPGFGNGTPVMVLIRSEGLSIHPAGAGDKPSAIVEAARMLGRSNLIHMHTRSSSGFDLHLHARTRGGYLPDPGTEVTVEIDPSLIFIFPQE